MLKIIILFLIITLSIGIYWFSKLIKENQQLKIKNATLQRDIRTVKARLQKRHTAYHKLVCQLRSLEHILESLPIGISIFDRAGKLYCRNLRAKRLLSGHTEIPDSNNDLYYQLRTAGSSLSYPVERSPLAYALQGKTSHIKDMEIHAANKCIPIEVWGAPVLNDDDEVIFAATVFQDITEHQRFEQAQECQIRQLREDESRFRTIAETLPLSLFIISFSDGRIIYANPQAAQTFGISLKKFIGRQIADLYCNLDDREKILNLLLKQGVVRNYEVQYCKADGSGFWVSISSKLLLFNHEQVVLTSVLDITERKKAEEERIQFTQELYALNQAYERFVPREFLSLLDKQSVVDVSLGDQVEKEMTILFSDIRDFTTLSEQMTPQENFNFINSYLSEMEPVIRQHRGFIDKYVGDSIMALFPVCADDALAGALAILKSLNHYNQRRLQQQQMPIRIGVGINTGKLMLGTIGGINRMDGTVIADAVNLAARVEGLTKTYSTPLIITANTYQKLTNPARYQIRVIDSVTVKGKSKEVVIYEVFDVECEQRQRLKQATLTTFEQGFVLYHAHRYEEARTCFLEVLDKHPSDEIAEIYVKRCQQQLDDLCELKSVIHVPDKKEVYPPDKQKIG